MIPKLNYFKNDRNQKYLLHKIIIRNKNYKTDDRCIDKYEKREHAH